MNRCFFTLPAALLLGSAFFISFLWEDTANTILSSIQLKKRNPFLNRYPTFKIIFISLLTIMVSGDMMLGYLASYKGFITGSIETVLPSSFYFLSMFSTAIYSIVVYIIVFYYAFTFIH